MDLAYLLVAAVVLFNAAASAVVFRASVFSTQQLVLQMALIWLVPIVGAVVCTLFALSQMGAAAPPNAVEPLYLPSDGGAPEGPGIGVCGCGSIGGGGDEGGGGD